MVLFTRFSREGSMGRRHTLKERGKKGKRKGQVSCSPAPGFSVQRVIAWELLAVGRQSCEACAPAVASLAGKVSTLSACRLKALAYAPGQRSSIFLSILFYCLIIVVL